MIRSFFWLRLALLAGVLLAESLSGATERDDSETPRGWQRPRRPRPKPEEKPDTGDGDGEQRLGLHVIRHQPCSHDDDDEWTNTIEFPSYKTSALIPDPLRQGCYRIGGTVKIARDVETDYMQIFLAIRHTANRAKPPETCSQYNVSNGCGGIGSCLYCDTCDAFDAAASSTQAQILKGEKPLSCHDDAVLEEGRHKDLYLSFCLPTKKEFLKSQNVDENIWNNLQQQTAGAGLHNHGRIGMFLEIFIFCKPVNQKLRRQRLLMDAYMKANKIGDERSMSIGEWGQQSFKFNHLISNGIGFCGCHKVFGNVYVNGNNPGRGGGHRPRR